MLEVLGFTFYLLSAYNYLLQKIYTENLLLGDPETEHDLVDASANCPVFVLSLSRDWGKCLRRSRHSCHFSSSKCCYWEKITTTQ